MLKKALLSVVVAGLLSATAHSQKSVAPKVSGTSPVVVAPFSASALNSTFDGSGQGFSVKSFLGGSRNNFAAKQKKANKEAAVLASVRSFAETARALFGNPKVISRRSPHPTLSRGERGSSAAPGEGEIDEEMRRSPRDNAERERIVAELFLQAGA